MKYEEQAKEFLKKTHTKFRAEFVGNDYYFEGDKEKRDIYRITLEREGKEPWSFKFGQSKAKSQLDPARYSDREIYRIRGKNFSSGNSRSAGLLAKQKFPPTAYDVLAGLTTSDIGTIDDFCANYGYETSKPSVIIKIYMAVCEEWANVQRVFGDVLDELREIQ